MIRRKICGISQILRLIYFVPLLSENIAVYQLKSQIAIIRVGDFGMPDYDERGNLRMMFPYTLQPWVKNWLDNNKKKLKKNV